MSDNSKPSVPVLDRVSKCLAVLTLLATALVSGTGVAATCTFTNVPTSTSLPNSGATGQTFQVQTQALCAWSTFMTVGDAAWITITSGGSGSNTGTVTFNVAPNTGPARVGTIFTDDPANFTINEADGCLANTNLTPPSASVAYGGAVGLTLQASYDPNCPTTGAGSNDAWITITGQSAVPGSASATYDVAANTGPARVGSITMQGVTFTVSQASGCIANTVLTPASASVGFGGAAGLTLQASYDPNCPATGAVSNDGWITITGQSGVPGSASATYDVAANTGPARVGTITMQGVTFTVNQGDGCSAGTILTPTSMNVAYGGAVGLTLQANYDPSCPAFGAGADDPWIMITSQSGVPGSSNATYDVAANTGPARAGTIAMQGVTFNVNQASGCIGNTVLTPAGASVGSAGATGLGVSATFPAACPITGVSFNDVWLPVTSQANLPGSASASYDVVANPGPARVGTITMQGVPFAVNQASGCTYLLSPASASLTAAGAVSQTFQVQASSPSCPWTAISNDAWLTVTAGANGTGTGPVTYSVAANPGPLRVGTITAGGQTFTVTQADGCTLMLSPASASPPAAGALGQTFQVQASSPSCSWTAISNDAWLTVTAGAAGTGTGPVTYSVAANTGLPRVGTITAGGQTFTVTQADGCTLVLSPASASPPAAGAVGQTFQVQASSPSCPWTAISNDAWLTVTAGANGTGTATVTYSVAANSGPLRVGTVTAGGQTFTVTQAGGCTLMLSPASASLTAAGAVGQTFQVQASAPSCPWTAISNDAWLTVTAGAAGTGTGPVTYSVAANTGLPRVGTITAGGQTFTVTQTGGCAFLLGPASASQTAAGAVGQTFQVQASAPACSWTAVSNDTWLTVTAGAAGTGTGTVTYSVAANPGPLRVGTITAGGQTFTVTQTDGCTYALNPASATPPAAGATGQSFQVLTSPVCSWSSASNAPWITITAGSVGTGDGVVSYNVGPNAGPARTGIISASGLTFVISQGDGCASATTLDPVSASVPAAGATGQTFRLVDSSACPWTASSNAPWISISSGASGSGTATITYSVAPNLGSPRTGTITAGGQTFTVNQASDCVANTTLEPVSASVPAAGAAGQSFQIHTPSDCPWIASSNALWITIDSGASGTGPASIIYHVASNSGAFRTGSITAGGQTFTVSQADGCAANTTLNPSSASAPAAGATGQSFQVQAGTGCSWTAISNAPWITVTAGASGTGTESVTYSVSVNSGGPRTGTIDAAGKTFTVSQGDGCSAGTTVKPDGASIPAAGGTGHTFQVQSATGCSWAAVSSAPWITITAGASGSGDGTVVYSVGADAGPARTGTITTAGHIFTVSQADGCTTGNTLEPVSASIPAAGAVGQSFQVQAAEGCSWTAISNAPWITISSGASGTGPASVSYSVAANSGADRTGAISVSGKSFTVNQALVCNVPSTPQITSYPTAPVVAGNSFTVAWGAVANLPATGTYQVQVSPNAECTSPVSSITTGLSVTLETDPAQAMTSCVRVRALAGPCAPNSASDYSPPITVRSLPLPAAFTVIQEQNPPARATRGAAPPTGSTVVFRNVGAAAGTLTLSTTGGFFSFSPQAPLAIAKGADASVSIVFHADSTGTSGARTGELIGTWSSGGGNESVAAAITLSVLEAESQSTRGTRLEALGSGAVHFRQRTGNPEPQRVTVRNTGLLPVRIAPSIGPGGSWLSVSGDFAFPIQPGTERTFDLTVDRSRRTTEDGPPPLSTALMIENVDGNPEDSATFDVFDEEPLPSGPGTGRSALADSEFSVILGTSASTASSGSRERTSAGDATQYVSDGWIRNRGSDSISVDVFYTPDGAQGLTDPRVKKNTITLAGYTAYRLSDFVKGLFGETGSGHVELRSTQLPQLSIRTSVDVITSRSGVSTQYGAELPLFVSGQGVVVSNGSVPAERILLSGLQGPLRGRRSNVIFSETLGKSIEVRARLYDTSGKPLGQKTVLVRPYSKTQVNAGEPELFPVPYADATLEVEPVSGEGAVSAFATVIDDTSQSYTVKYGAVLAAPQTPSRAALAAVESTAFLPIASHEKTTDAFYTTQFSVTNAADSDVALQITFIPDQGFGDPVGPRALVIPKRGGVDGQTGPQTVVYSDVLKNFLGIDNATRGMLKVVGALSAVSFSSETTTPLDPQNAALGSSLSSVNPAPGIVQKIAGAFAADSLEVAGVKQSDTDTVSAEVSLPAIEEGQQYRTNLILAELAGVTSKVRVILRTAGGASLGEPLVVDLGPNERKQISQIILAIAATPGGVGDFKDVEIIVQAVEGKGRTLALVNRISKDPASKRIDTSVLGPNVTGGKKKGQK